MKPLLLKLSLFIIFIGFLGSLATPIHAQAPSEKKEKRSHLQRFKDWMRDSYGTPRKDIRFLWSWG